MIPKILHFYYESPGSDDDFLPADVKKNIVAWKEKHPDFLIKIWSRSEIELELDFFDGVSRLKKSFCTCKLPAMRSDIARLLVLHSYGGIYNDLKNYPNSSFLNELLSFEFVITEHQPTINRESFNDYFTNSFIASTPKNPLLLQILKKVDENITNRLVSSVVDITGLTVLQRSIKSNSDMHLKKIKSIEAWGGGGQIEGFMKRTSLSYNGKNNKLHWTKMQNVTGLYH